MRLSTKIVLLLLPAIAPLLAYNVVQYQSQVQNTKAQIGNIGELTVKRGSTSLTDLLISSAIEYKHFSQIFRQCVSNPLDISETIADDISLGLRNMENFSLFAIVGLDGSVINSVHAPIDSNRYILPRDIRGLQVIDKETLDNAKISYWIWRDHKRQVMAELASAESELMASQKERSQTSIRQMRLLDRKTLLREYIDSLPGTLSFGGREIAVRAGLPFKSDTYIFTMPLIDCDGELQGFATAFFDWTLIQDGLYEIMAAIQQSGVDHSYAALYDVNRKAWLSHFPDAYKPAVASVLNARDKPQSLTSSMSHDIGGHLIVVTIPDPDLLVYIALNIDIDHLLFDNREIDQRVERASDYLLAAFIPANEVMRRTDHVLYEITLWSLISIAFMVLLIYMATRKITRPIASLVETMKQVSKGPLHYRAEVKGDDEVGNLAQAFNQMTTALQEQQVEIGKKAIDITKNYSLLDATLESTADGILVINQHRKVVKYNKQFAELWGMSPELLEGRDDRQLLDFAANQLVDPKEFLSQVNDLYAQLEKSGDDLLFLKDGRVFQRHTRPQYIEGRIIGRVWSFLDITHSFKAKEKINEERQFLQSVINCVSDPILVVDLDCNVMLANHAATEGMDHDSVNKGYFKCYQMKHFVGEHCHREADRCLLSVIAEECRPRKSVHSHVMPDGTKRIFEMVATPLWNSVGEMVGIIEASREITQYHQMVEELQEKEHHLEFLAHHDQLTDLPNRLLMMDRLELAIQKAHRANTLIAVLFVDLDRFKQINDSLGHHAGDEVLREVSARLLKGLREGDTLARLGGDEFTVILEGLNSHRYAAVVAGKLIKAVSGPFAIEEHTLYLTASVGISLFPNDGKDVNALLRNADSAMYHAKKTGRNRFQYYTEDMTQEAYERVLLEAQLRTALEQNQLELFYQPQIDIQTNYIFGMEALLRWNHPEFGLLAPDRFLSIAEETGMIVEIGDWVLVEACRTLKEWHKQDMSHCRMAINIAGAQLRWGGFVKRVEEIIEEFALPPGSIELEVTENAMMNNPESYIKTLIALRGLGVELAIDDFGTGQTTLTYLRRLPVTTLKIDRSFVGDIPADKTDAAIAQAIITLGRNLDLCVIAEGVESKAQWQFLKNNACAVGQGYYISRPLPKEEIEAWMTDRQVTDQPSDY